jgi:hypothetical protein
VFTKDQYQSSHFMSYQLNTNNQNNLINNKKASTSPNSSTNATNNKIRSSSIN